VSTCTSRYIIATSSTIQRSAGARTAVLTDEKPRLVDGSLLWQENEALCSKSDDPQAHGAIVHCLEVYANKHTERTLWRRRRFGRGWRRQHQPRSSHTSQSQKLCAEMMSARLYLSRYRSHHSKLSRCAEAVLTLAKREAAKVKSRTYHVPCLRFV
jgi:hypothetical protein